MRFTEIATRLSGVSSPVFGVSWNPPEAEVTAAKRIIAYLEDRRVLYAPTSMEYPSHCVESVLDVRRFLTEELGKLDPHNPLAQNLQGMCAACRKFLNQIQTLSRGDDERYDRFMSAIIQHMGSYEAWVFISALGELRTTVGLHIALIAVRNGLDIEDDLATILPGELDNDGSVVLDW
ncbi:MAG: hypothetical protein QM753_20535 [Thermomicrobiales bacterium]